MNISTCASVSASNGYETKRGNMPTAPNTRLRPKSCLLQARSFEQIRSAEVLCICDTAQLNALELLGAAGARTETVLINSRSRTMRYSTRLRPTQQLN